MFSRERLEQTVKHSHKGQVRKGKRRVIKSGALTLAMHVSDLQFLKEPGNSRWLQILTFWPPEDKGEEFPGRPKQVGMGFGDPRLCSV